MLLQVLLLSIVILASCNKNDSNTESGNITDDTIRIFKEGLNHPWEILWGKDDFIWITERDGKISKLDPNSGNTVFSQELPDVVARGEGGLLGMVQDPGFLENGWLYVVYNYESTNGYREKVVRLQFDGNALVNPRILIDNIAASNIHNGSRLWIIPGNSAKLFISTGDASNGSSSQAEQNVNGKILRLNLDGSIPADNPLPGSPYWSLGHRNIQGLVVANDIMYASEHGPNIEDEVNIIEKGRNYGWPQINGPCDGNEVNFCASNNVKEPIWSSGNGTVAVCGMDYYNQDLIPDWKNSLLMTTLKDATLYQHKLSSDGKSIISTTKFYEDEWGRLRDVCISPQGKVYLGTSNGSNDKIIEISRLSN